MRTIILLLRLISGLFAYVGVFTCVIIIGFVFISISQDLYELSNKLEYKYIKN